jgi:hypothetical protein
MDYDSIAKAGSMLGSGAVIVMDETRCMVKSLLRLSYFYFEESCGQCTPCREGTGWLYRMVNRIENGKAAGRSGPAELGGRQHHGPHHLRARRCGGDAGARILKHFREEFEYHIEHKHCWSGTTEAWQNMVEIEIDGKKVEVPEGSMVMDAANKPAPTSRTSATTRNCPSRPTAACAWSKWKRPQAAARLRHAGDNGMIVRTKRQGRQGAEVGDGIPADQPPAGLPDLRPGRRVPAAGSGRGLRRFVLALQEEKRVVFPRTWAR